MRIIDPAIGGGSGDGAHNSKKSQRFIGFDQASGETSKQSRSPAVLTFLWVASLAVMIFFAALPVSIEAQMVLSWGTVGLFILGGKLWHKRIGRVVAVSLVAFISLRYMIWRTMNTIPGTDEMSNFVPGVLLYGAEIYAFFMFLLSLFVLIDPIRRKTAEKLPEDESLIPTVDVYVPTLDESPELLQSTLIAAKQMKYPKDKIRVHLLDDGSTLEKRSQADQQKAQAAQVRHQAMKALCVRLGVNYLSRDYNDQAKAGNLNHAFERTHGDLIVVFDADHVPAPNFLEKTVAHFLQDKDLFLVQTPQFFINPDPLEQNLNTFGQMPSENEMFYGEVQRGLDKWNATFFCGSAALLKRQALEEVGGFVGDTVTEDAETALELHAKGWRSFYLSEPLVAGLQPSSFNNFIRQRSRWAQGMLQLFLLKNPLFKKGLSWGQKLSYLSSNMFWLFSFARLVFIMSPLLFILFGLEIYKATSYEFMAYTVPYLIAGLMLGTVLYGKVRWPLISELYEYIQSIFLSKALIRTFLNPRHPRFRVTDKVDIIEEDQLSSLARPFIIMTGFLTLCLLVCIYRYFTEPLNAGVLMVVGFWNLFNLLISLAGLGVVYEKRQLRKTPRMPFYRPGVLQVDGENIQGYTKDLSVGGMCFKVPATAVHGLPLQGKTVNISTSLPGSDNVTDFTVQVMHMRPQNNSYLLGVKFDHQSEYQVMEAIRLFYGDSAEWKEWQETRHHRPSAISGLAYFVRLSLLRGLPALAFVIRQMTGLKKKEKAAPIRLTSEEAARLAARAVTGE